MSNKQFNNEFKNLISDIQSQYGKENILLMDKQDQNIEFYNSGNLQLDEILGGGFPKGRIIEIFGNESCGKTTVCLQAISNCQKQGGKCIYFDLERSLSKKYCQDNGIDTNDLLLITPDNGEQMFNIMEKVIKSGMVNMIVVDSVAAIVPKVESEGDFEEQTIGLAARIMSKGLRNIQPLIDKYKTTVIFINQIREKIGVVYGSNETTTGGRALRFYASIRLELRKSELIKNHENVIGIKIIAKTTKNKIAAPIQKTFLNIYFSKGYDHTADVVEIAIEKKIITKSGSWFYFNEEKIAQGKEATIQSLKTNIELEKKIESCVKGINEN